MMGQIDNAQLLDILLKDYDRVTQELISVQERADAVFGLGSAVLGALLVYGIQGNTVEILVVAPVATFLILAYAIKTYTLVFAHGGYRRYLEERISSIAGTNNLLKWENKISQPILLSGSGIWIVYVLSGLIPLAVSGYSVILLWRRTGATLATAVIIVIGGLATAS